MRYIAMLLLALLSACGGGGSLTGDPDLANYDFEYREEFTRGYESLYTGEVLTLRARFIWTGPRAEQITSPQHVVLAFTQSAFDGNPRNDEGEVLFTHGAGALVGEYGLAMELWFRDGMATNAYVWRQDFNRCMVEVIGTIETGTRCLDDRLSPNGYITSAPGFALQKGIAYVLHIRIAPGLDGQKELHAELYQESGDTFVLVQHGMVRFPPERHFPVQGQSLQASVARTPGTDGEPAVDYLVF
jgi:hypothetical protein